MASPKQELTGYFTQSGIEIFRNVKNDEKENPEYKEFCSITPGEPKS